MVGQTDLSFPVIFWMLLSPSASAVPGVISFGGWQRLFQKGFTERSGLGPGQHGTPGSLEPRFLICLGGSGVFRGNPLGRAGLNPQGGARGGEFALVFMKGGEKRAQRAPWSRGPGAKSPPGEFQEALEALRKGMGTLGWKLPALAGTSCNKCGRSATSPWRPDKMLTLPQPCLLPRVGWGPRSEPSMGAWQGSAPPRAPK